MRNSPAQLRLVLIDPKRVELQAFESLPHLLVPIVSDGTKAASVLKAMVNLMEERYALLAEHKVRNIAAYNESQLLVVKRLPLIVVVIDELADLMATNRKDAEGAITRLTQMARAAGIHIVAATQRPSVDVITGVIKANIPARIAFTVSSQVDSRTILDESGAEKLLGKGDMLYRNPEDPVLQRIQGSYLSDREIARIASHAMAQAKPQYDETLMVAINEK
ncbi:unnamed protein product [Didymodactylos carnosus]|uniref:FtsK domain-containing protein n=1 Tax=Didymodactylos carnosus TaxID=1234261 RepID=A0A8S2GH08_9BILA|nr:unnamed protein product [Didymodactylos carnosus]CAF3492073.1 unnamed protein product [Didymodactylos carnosus]